MACARPRHRAWPGGYPPHPLARRLIHQRKLREHDEFVQSFAALEHMAYEPHIDYRKKRGLIEEINRAVLNVQDEQAARGAIRNAAPPGV